MNKAKWEFDDADEYGYTYKCSNCGALIMCTTKRTPKPSECEKCEAVMEEENEIIKQ